MGTLVEEEDAALVGVIETGDTGSGNGNGNGNSVWFVGFVGFVGEGNEKAGTDFSPKCLATGGGNTETEEGVLCIKGVWPNKGE